MVDFTIDKDEHIDFILNNFDFDKVHKIMTFLDWEWIDFKQLKSSVPTIGEMKAAVTEMMYDICESNYDNVEVGGFRVNKYDDHLELIFKVAGFESEILNNGLEYEMKKQQKERRNKIKNIEK